MISLTPNLKVEDVKETIKFYKNVLNFEIVLTVPDYEKEKLNFGMVKNGEVCIMFQEKLSLEEEYSILKGGVNTKGLTLFAKVDNLEELYENVKTKARVIKEIHNTFYNTKEFAILDNNGFVLTFAQ